MLPEAIELIVVTPERQLLKETVVEVTIPGLDGELGVLPGHAPLMTELGVGELRYKTANSGQPTALAIIQGFAEVLPDRVTVLAETAERAEEIDLSRAERALERAQRRIAQPTPEVDWARAEFALRRALIRVQLARKYRGEPAEVR
jgi:F-type H+-transporting ATPase subunit epsilon